MSHRSYTETLAWLCNQPLDPNILENSPLVELVCFVYQKDAVRVVKDLKAYMKKSEVHQNS